MNRKEVTDEERLANLVERYSKEKEIARYAGITLTEGEVAWAIKQIERGLGEDKYRDGYEQGVFDARAYGYYEKPALEAELRECRTEAEDLRRSKEIEYRDHKDYEASMIRENERLKDGIKSVYRTLLKDGKYYGRIEGREAYNLILDIEKIDEGLAKELDDIVEEKVGRKRDE